MYNKNGQMEIFGLVVIVILLAIGLLFAVIILTKTPSTEVQRVKESVQAANFLNTMFSTTTQCDKKTVRDLLQDCALATQDWSGANKCNGKTTCQVMQELIDQMLKETLGKWGKNYEYSITGTQAVEQIKIQTTQCTGEREASIRPEKIRTGLDVQVTLYIC